MIEGGISQSDLEGRPATYSSTWSRAVRHPSGGFPFDAAGAIVHVMPKPGVTDPEAESARVLLADLGYPVTNVRTIRTYWIEGPVVSLPRLIERVLSNDAVELAVIGSLPFAELGQGQPYRFHRVEVRIHDLDDQALLQLSLEGQLALSLAEMKAIQRHFAALGRDPTDCELETLAQTWSEHCSHKTLRGALRLKGVRSTTCSSRPSSGRPTSWDATGW